MPVKKYKPVTPGTRGMTGYTFDEITKSKPERSLIVDLRKSGGRNAQGRVTVRHRGGGHRRYIRLVDFKRDKHNIPAKVAAIEYDPNRTARLALLHYADGEKRYILAPMDIKVGDTLMSGAEVEIRPGNALPISNIPVGTLIHNIEVKEGRGGQMVRSAGGSAQLLAKEAILPRSACLQVRSASFVRIVMRPLARSGTSITEMSSTAKPVENAIWVFAQLSAVLR